MVTIGYESLAQTGIIIQDSDQAASAGSHPKIQQQNRSEVIPFRSRLPGGAPVS